MLRNLFTKLRHNRKNILAAVLGHGLSMVGILVGTRVLTEVTSTAVFGEAKLLIGLVAMVTGMVLQPFTQFAMRQYHDAEENGRQVSFQLYARRTLLYLSLICGALLVAGLWIYRPPGVLSPVLLIGPVVGAMLLTQAMFNLEVGLLTTRNRQVATSFMENGRQWGLPFVTALAIAWIADSSFVFLAAQSLVFVLLLILCYRFVSRIPSRPRESRELTVLWTHEARLFVTPMLALGIFQWAASIGDRYIIAAFVDLSDVGRYSAIYGLISMPFLAFVALVARLLYPVFFKASATENEHRRRWLKLGMLGTTAGIAGTALLAVFLFGDLIARVALAEEYRTGARLLMVWIAAGYGFLAVASTFEMEAYADKKTFILTIAYGLAAVTKVIATLLLLPKEGILGAAQATCLAFAVYMIVLAVAAALRKRGAVPS